MSYKVMNTNDPTASTAFSGKVGSDGSVIIYTSAADNTAKQMVFSNGTNAPDLTGSDIKVPEDMRTSIIPRFGANVASPERRPPVLSIVPFGGFIPVQVSSDDPQHDAVVYAFPASEEGYTNTVLPRFWAFDSLSGMYSGNQFDTFPPRPTDPSTFKVVSGTIETPSSVGITGYIINGSAHMTLPPAGFILIIGDITVDVPTACKTVLIATGTITISTNLTSIAPTSYLAVVSMKSVLNKDGVLVSSSDISNGWVVIGGVATPNGIPLIRSGSVQGSSKLVRNPGPDEDVKNGTPIKTTILNEITQIDPEGNASKLMPACFAFGMSGTTELPKDGHMEAFLRNQFAMQFGGVSDVRVVPVSGSSYRGSFHVQYTFDGNVEESFVVVQQDAKSFPNAGVATEPHRFDKYIEAPMAQTYRVSEDGYAFWQKGKFITIDGKGDFVMSTAPSSPFYTAEKGSGNLDATLVGLGVQSYNLNDSSNTLISSDRNQSISSPPGTNTDARMISGGADSFDAPGESNIFVSKYTYVPWSPSSSTSGTVFDETNVNEGVSKLSQCDIAAPYISFVKYRPLNGRISGVNVPPELKDAFSLEDGTLIVHNTSRRARSMALRCAVNFSAATGVSAAVNQNVLYHYDRSSNPTVVYYDRELIDLLCLINGDEKIVSLKADVGPVDVLGDGSMYSYKTVADDKTGLYLNEVLIGQTYSIVAANQGSFVMTVFFGDTVQDEPFKRYEHSSEGFGYLASDHTQIVVYQPPGKTIIPVDLSEFDGTFCSEKDLNELRIAGFSVSYSPNERTTVLRATKETQAVVSETLLVYGRKAAWRAKDAETATTDIIGGEYQFLDKDNKPVTIKVQNDGKVDALLLPFTMGFNTYIETPADVSGGGTGGESMIEASREEIEFAVNPLGSGSFIRDSETTLEWNASLDANLRYTKFGITKGNVGDTITHVKNGSPKTYILTEPVKA